MLLALLTPRLSCLRFVCFPLDLAAIGDFTEAICTRRDRAPTGQPQPDLAEQVPPAPGKDTEPARRRVVVRPTGDRTATRLGIGCRGVRPFLTAALLQVLIAQGTSRILRNFLWAGVFPFFFGGQSSGE